MLTPASSRFWQLIDGGFVVNLDQRPDRWIQFEQATRELIPPGRVRRYPACLGRELPGFGQRPWFRGGKRDHTWAGRAGCLLSHRGALLQARQLGWRTVLLLEDDVEFVPAFDVVASSLAAALQTHDWQVCYLGFTEPWPPGRRLAGLEGSAALYQVHGCTTTHAYVVRESARDWILEHLPDESRVWPWLATHRAIDRWYQRQLGLHFSVVCVSPGLVHQTASVSDIVTPKPGRDRRASEPEPMVAPSSHSFTYYVGRLLRRGSVHAGLLGDTLRGYTRRLGGF